LLAKRKKTSTPTPSKGLSDVKEFASEKKNTGETKLRKVLHDRLDVLCKTSAKQNPARSGAVCEFDRLREMTNSLKANPVSVTI